MTPLQKLNALGFEKANRILAEKVMGWEPWSRSKRSVNRERVRSWQDAVTKEITRCREFNPCRDLNDAKMVVDKLSKTDFRRWAETLYRVTNVSHYEVFNAPAYARCAAVMEALNLWPEEVK